MKCQQEQTRRGMRMLRMSSMDVIAWNSAGLYPAVAASGCSPHTVCERLVRLSSAALLVANAAVRGDDADALSTATADGNTRGFVSIVTFGPLPSLASAI